MKRAPFGISLGNPIRRDCEDSISNSTISSNTSCKFLDNFFIFEWIFLYRKIPHGIFLDYYPPHRLLHTLPKGLVPGYKTLQFCVAYFLYHHNEKTCQAYGRSMAPTIS